MRAAGALALLLVITGCAAASNGLSQTPGDVNLLVATSDQIAVIDSRSHATERVLPLGVPSSDWRHLYSISGDSLLDSDPGTGATATVIPLGAAYRLPVATISGLPGGLSPNGRWLVAESYDGAATHFVIVDTQAASVVMTTRLSGSFHVDAVSNDGLRLYLIQYLSGKEYFVRLYNVASRSLDPNVVVDKSNGERSMAGERLSGVASPSGDRLFSLYVREGGNPFVHALSLDGTFAFCIDLPGSGYAGNHAEMNWSLAMNSGGTRLYAVNGATGVIADLDVSSEFDPHVARTARIAGGGHAGSGSLSAVLSRDGRTLVAAAASGIIWVDTSSLTVRMHALDGWGVSSIALGPDGRTVYAIDGRGRVAALSLATGQLLESFESAAGPPAALMRVAAA